jgi:hypothetical protein
MATRNGANDILGKVIWLALSAAVSSAVTAFSGPRDDVKAVLWLVIFLIGAVALVISDQYRYRIQQKSEAEDRAERRRKHDTLQDKAILCIIRSQLVVEHDRLVQQGCADDTERTSWDSSYDIYEQLIQEAGITNGVMDDYRSDIASLPLRVA